MAGHPSSPLAAAVGLVAFAADGVRKLPQALLEAGVAAHRRYDELARHGQEVLSGGTRAPGYAEPAAPPHIPVTDLPETAPPTKDVPAKRVPAKRVPVKGVPVNGAPVTEVPVTEVPRVRPPIGRTAPVDLPEDLQEEVAQLTPGADLAHDELPLADFDHQTVPQLRGRLRTLTLAQLVQLRDYEQAHAARLPVLTLLDNRIARLLEDTAQ